MLALLTYAVVAGIAIAEGLRRAVAGIDVHRRLAHLQVALVAFRAAEDDDSRQRLLLQAGWRTLSLSLLLFATLAIGCLLVALPLIWMTPTSGAMAAYMGALTVAALAWWRLRQPSG